MQRIILGIINIFLVLFIFHFHTCSDPFGMTIKHISGGYYIHKFDESIPINYYILRKGDCSRGGVFDGIVNRLIWSNNILFADIKRLCGLDESGWYELNLLSGKISKKKINLSKTVSAKDFFDNPKKHYNLY